LFASGVRFRKQKRAGYGQELLEEEVTGASALRVEIYPPIAFLGCLLAMLSNQAKFFCTVAMFLLAFAPAT
jgi:hypothetical protein